MNRLSTQDTSELSIANSIDAEALSSDAFKLAFRNHAAGAAIVTADAGEGPVAMTVTSLFSVSAEPPLFVFSASDFSSSTPTLLRADTLVVQFPGADQLELAQLAATSGVDRFPEGTWTRLPTGEPFYPAADSWIRGRISHRLNAGTSTIFVVEALTASASASDPGSACERPLVYHNRSWHVLDDTSRL